MSKFKAGDAVRVKGGTFDILSNLKGRKLIVESVFDEIGMIRVDGGGWYDGKFEHWNESEEWDGEKWVPKKVPGLITERHIDINYTGEPPATIAINGVKYVREPEKRPVSPILDASRAGLGIGFSFNGVKQDFIIQNYEHDYITNTDTATIKSITPPRKVGA